MLVNLVCVCKQTGVVTEGVSLRLRLLQVKCISCRLLLVVLYWSRCSSQHVLNTKCFLRSLGNWHRRTSCLFRILLVVVPRPILDLFLEFLAVAQFEVGLVGLRQVLDELDYRLQCLQVVVILAVEEGFLAEMSDVSHVGL